MSLGICPEKPAPTYLMVLDKSPSQEEFIRGSMTANPYSSTEVLPHPHGTTNHFLS
jgi:E3 ubiquitin-protein ligase UBR4